MKKNYSLIDSEVKRTNKWLGITNLIFFLITVYFFASYFSNMYNFFFGPFPLDANEFGSKVPMQIFTPINYSTAESQNPAATDAEKQDAIAKAKAIMYQTESVANASSPLVLNGSKYYFLIHETPVYEFKNFTPDVDFQFFRYVLLPYADGYILVKADVSVCVNDMYKGQFGPMSIALQDDLGKIIPSEYKGKIYSQMIYGVGLLDFSISYDMITIAFFLLISMVMGFFMFRRLKNKVRYHPIYKKLEWYGDPVVIAAQIDAEYLADTTKEYGKEVITESFYIVRRKYWTNITANEHRLGGNKYEQYDRL